MFVFLFERTNVILSELVSLNNVQVGYKVIVSLKYKPVRY